MVSVIDHDRNTSRRNNKKRWIIWKRENERKRAGDGGDDEEENGRKERRERGSHKDVGAVYVNILEKFAGTDQLVRINHVSTLLLPHLEKTKNRTEGEKNSERKQKNGVFALSGDRTFFSPSAYRRRISANKENASNLDQKIQSRNNRSSRPFDFSTFLSKSETNLVQICVLLGYFSVLMARRTE